MRAGGTIIKFAHPFLSGQISQASPVDEIDVSRALRLNDTFFNATPAQDSSFQETLVDGSVIIITNHLLNGSMSLSVLPTTGLVGTGDLVAALQFIKASGDDVGGTMTRIKFVNGVRITRIYYGVTVKNVPDDILAGNSVPVYPCTLLYAGWVEGTSANTDVNEKVLWAVGNRTGLKGAYKPYAIIEAENANNFYGGSPINDGVGGVGAGRGDTDTADLDNYAEIPDPLPSGISGTPAPSTVTWTSGRCFLDSGIENSRPRPLSIF
jgi:hypothetical protein